MVWVIKNQVGRRNLEPFQRTSLVLKMEEIIRAKAKERQGTRNDLKNNFVPNWGRSENNEPDNTDEEEITGLDDDSEPFPEADYSGSEDNPPEEVEEEDPFEDKKEDIEEDKTATKTSDDAKLNRTSDTTPIMDPENWTRG